MRLLHLIQSAKPTTGGVIEAVNQLSVALLEQGHRVEVASLDAPGELPEREGAFPVHSMGRGRSGYGYANNFAPWLRKACGNFDAVIVNGLWQHVGLAGRSVCVEMGKPYYVFPHGTRDFAGRVQQAGLVGHRRGRNANRAELRHPPLGARRQ